MGEEAGGGERLREYEEAIEKLSDVRVANLREIWVEYDRNTDTLYINFGKEEADESIMIDDDTAVHLSQGRLVGITIYNASKRLGLTQY